MVAVTTFYIDDSGTRHPDHHPNRAMHGRDWFALGGILIDDDKKEQAEELIRLFRKGWPQMGLSPLHSCDIRGAHENFAWLGKRPGLKERFMGDLERLLLDLPVLGMACVIDRPGYNQRYQEKYGGERWSLCKTAFAVAVERAVKHAKERGRKLSIYIERSSKTDDATVAEYFQLLKTDGHWFDAQNASKYAPLGTRDYAETLYDFKKKDKLSPLMQIADLYLWPMCMGGYRADNRAYATLRAAGKLMDCVLKPHEIPHKGIKYSCFDLVANGA